MPRATPPMSPHLEIYRWYPTMLMSIAHRVTGSALAVGLLLITWWLVALASGPEAFATAQAVLDSWFGGLVLFAWTLMLFYHLGNGVRHLAWDAGYGYDLPTAYTSGYGVLAFAGAATMLVWLVVLIA